MPGTDALTVDLAAVADSDLDVDLHARFGLPVVILDDGTLETDQSSQGLTGLESVEFPQAGDCLQPGPYFFVVANFEEVPVEYRMVADRSGTECLPVRFDRRVADTTPAAEPPVLLTQYCLTAGPETGGFQVDLAGQEAGETRELDLSIRHGQPVERDGGMLTADLRSERPGPLESLSVPGDGLAGGTYFVGILSRSPEPVPYELRVRSLREGERPIEIGEQREAVAPASTAAGIPWLAPEQFVLEVPAGPDDLRLELASTSREGIAFHVRKDQRVVIDGTRVVADRSDGWDAATREIVLESPSAGTYYLAVENATARAVAVRVGVTSEAVVSIIRGDVDEGGGVDLSDAISTLNHLFGGGREICIAAADADGSGGVTVTDPIVTLNHLFLGGPPLAAPFPGCGAVSGEDLEGCSGGACP